MLINHLTSGTDDTLSYDLRESQCFHKFEERVTSKVTLQVRVPITAAQTFSEGEFNRYYIRAMCNRAIIENRFLIIYRARFSEKPRADSERLIGTRVDAGLLLADLRRNIGLDTILGMPSGPNSGLSVEFQVESI